MKNQPGVLKIILWLLSLPYHFIMATRNLLYDRGILKTIRLPVPVVAVGNLTHGGTGKTPLVIALAALLQKQGYKIGIITRGYKRNTRGQIVVKDGKNLLASPSASGDEPYLIAQKTKDAVIIADANRIAAGWRAINDYHCNLLIADDAYQHRRLHRDLNLLLWDGSSVPQNERVAPLGHMRESWQGLRRADILFISRTTHIPESMDLFFQQHQPDLIRTALPVSIQSIVHYDNHETIAVDEIMNRRLLAFCGLGNPRQFFKTLQILSPAELVRKSFPDHHKYNELELNRLIAEATRCHCDYLITTEKDAVNLPGAAQAVPNLLILQITCQVNKNIEAAILQKLQPPKTDS
jgi:tetraacyldisaccharide 4'-kinase